MDIGLRRSGLSLDDQYIKSPAPTPARAGDHFLVANDGAAVVPGCFSLARLLPPRKPPQRVFPLFPPAATRALLVGGMGGVVRLPPVVHLFSG